MHWFVWYILRKVSAVQWLFSMLCVLLQPNITSIFFWDKIHPSQYKKLQQEQLKLFCLVRIRRCAIGPRSVQKRSKEMKVDIFSWKIIFLHLVLGWSKGASSFHIHRQRTKELCIGAVLGIRERQKQKMLSLDKVLWSKKWTFGWNGPNWSKWSHLLMVINKWW